jgi:MarR family transcriptional regulator for hemolysin
MFYDRFRSTGYLSNWIARLMAKAIDTRLKPIGMSAHGDALSQRALTEFAAIEQPTMAATLSRMERDGLVARRPDPNDRRAWLYTLSDEGKAKSIKVREAGQAINEAALADLTQNERDVFLAALAKVVSNLEAYLRETRPAED